MFSDVRDEQKPRMQPKLNGIVRSCPNWPTKIRMKVDIQKENRARGFEKGPVFGRIHRKPPLPQRVVKSGLIKTLATPKSTAPLLAEPSKIKEISLTEKCEISLKMRPKSARPPEVPEVQRQLLVRPKSSYVPSCTNITASCSSPSQELVRPKSSSYLCRQCLICKVLYTTSHQCFQDGNINSEANYLPISVPPSSIGSARPSSAIADLNRSSSYKNLNFAPRRSDLMNSQSEDVIILNPIADRSRRPKSSPVYNASFMDHVSTTATRET